VSLIFHQVRLVLVGLRTKESEEVVKAFSGWPTIERACIGRIFVRSYTVFANRECVVAVVAKNLCNVPAVEGTCRPSREIRRT
jgi:hypothetical protein